MSHISIADSEVTQLTAWLLHIACDGGIAFSMIWGPREYVEGQWNMPYLEVSYAQIAAELMRMQRKGWVRFDLGTPVTLDGWPSEDDLRRMMRLRKRSFGAYWLTPNGGQLWEALFAPDWSRYYSRDHLDSRRNTDSSSLIGISALTRELATEATQVFLVCEDYVMDATSVEYFPLKPWEISYWKQLPAGFQIQFFAKYLVSQTWPDTQPYNREQTLAFVQKFVHWHNDVRQVLAALPAAKQIRKHG